MSQFNDILKRKAAALQYDPQNQGAPVVVASGMGYVAEKITETALEAGIPVYEDESLASLLTQLKLGTEIPEELYQAIVEIYVYFLGYTGDGREGSRDKSKGPEQTQSRKPEETKTKTRGSRKAAGTQNSRKSGTAPEQSAQTQGTAPGGRAPERMTSSGYHSRREYRK